MNDSFLGTFKVDEIDSAVDIDAVILGVPFEDNMDIYPKGATLAPKTIRESSNYLSGQSFTQQSIHQQNVLDFGDIKVNSDYKKTIQIQSKKIESIFKKKAMPVIIGGDHSIALGTAMGIELNKQEIDGIVWLDAHLDLMEKYPKDEKYTRATVLKRIFELEKFDQKEYYFIGTRGHNLGLEEVDFVKENDMKVLETNRITDYSSIDKFIQNITSNNLYVSLDIDVLDPAFAPGVSVPEPGGLSTRELFYIISKLAKKIKCFEIVEVNPKVDMNNQTSLVACKAIFELFDNK
ncbi:MAG: arginase family protein [Asgard group archaeon]|nr:arginase family protein [Asgard group archaeon]